MIVGAKEGGVVIVSDGCISESSESFTVEKSRIIRVEYGSG